MATRRASNSQGRNGLLSVHVGVRQRRLLGMNGESETLAGNFNVSSRIEAATRASYHDSHIEIRNGRVRVTLREGKQREHQLVDAGVFIFRQLGDGERRNLPAIRRIFEQASKQRPGFFTYTGREFADAIVTLRIGGNCAAGKTYGC